MDLLSRKRIFIFVVLVGFTQATSPYIKDPGPGYTSITEDFSGTICRFHIVDTDQGDIITVKPADDFTVQYFNIVTNGGTNDVWVNVTVKKPLDRETLGGMVKINLVILDTQHDEVKYDHTVYISDVNDNRPELQDLPYTLDINEQPCNRTTVYTNIHAIDKDSGVNGKVGYSMKPKAQSQESRKKYSETFSIDPKTGSVSLNQCLDYESNSYYQFIVTAKDFGPNGGLNSTAEFIIRVQDVQDKPPFFTGIPYRAAIGENSAKGTLIVQIHAEDGDPGVSNNVNYTITDSTCGDVFHVDSFSGDITTSGNIDLDAGKVKNESGNCIITVLAEEIESAGEEQYGNTTASTHITVSVQDVDDNLPSFGKSSYHATVPENTPNGVPLSLNETVSVNDIDQANNARMKITLEYPNHSSCEDFTASPPVVQGFGEILILVKNTSLLDYEKIQNIVIKVVAMETANESHIAEAYINIDILDVNDNNPKFSNTPFTLSIDENSSNGTNITQITATDADISPMYNTLSYSISGGNGRFIVDKTTGDILVKCSNCTAELDREKQNIYYLTYTAKDVDGRSDSASLVIELLDVNDETPVFLSSSYKVIIDENDEQYVNKTPLIKVEARDNDKADTNNSAVVYNITKTSVANFWTNFTINHTTGKIYLKSALDYERLINSRGEIDITVQASDKGNPQLSSSVIVTLNVQDMNDNQPTFNCTMYKAEIREDATQYTPVEQVFATDDDGTNRNKDLSYIIIRGGSDRFTINATSGEVSVQLGARFDRETVPNYNLTIFAIDQGYPPKTGTTTLSVDLTDVNDKSPEFSQSEYFATVIENAYSSSFVNNCSASDDDLDKELKSSITNKAASDENGKTVNQSLVSLPCNKTPVTVYTEIHATDEDSNANGRVSYLMEPKAQSPESRQKYKETFSIDPVTGSVSLNQCLDYESNSYYQFIVTAKDSGPNGGLSSTAEFTIHVKDVQDEPPFFTGIYRKPIKANTPKGSEAARVHAIDGDQGVSNEIHYSITYSSCGDGLFIINSATGVIYTSRNIDRNSGTIRQQFGYCTVTVEASEIQKVNETQYGNTTASTNVTITLQDFNAHQPTTTDVTGIAASTLQPTKQTLPSLNCTEPWNFQSPCNESTIQAGVTKFPHPASHHKFLICDASGKTYSAYCPPNEVFHAGCSSCAPPLQRFSASCQLFKDDFTNPCSKENVIAGNLTFPYPNSSTKYIRCDTLGNAWVEECLSGSLWDQANLVCMLPAAYNPCHRRGSMVQSLFPHYCNPRLYVQCGNNQQPFVHTCQKNYVFLQWDLTCIPPGFPGSEHLRYTCN